MGEISNSKLPGQGHRALHNIAYDGEHYEGIQGIHSHTEAANFLNGKRGPVHFQLLNHITEHPNHRSALHAIIHGDAFRSLIFHHQSLGREPGAGD
jgi:hypothetical protein